MPGFRDRRFTIYDAMEAAGVFEANPANPISRDPMTGESLYKGPVELPRMFYHPEGLMRITVPAEIMTTPMGPKYVGEQRELIHEIAKTPEDEARLRASGWHDHPAKAMRASGKGTAPPESAVDRIADLEAQIRRLQADRDGEQAHQLAQARHAGAVVSTRSAQSEAE